MVKGLGEYFDHRDIFLREQEHRIKVVSLLLETYRRVLVDNFSKSKDIFVVSFVSLIKNKLEFEQKLAA